MTSHVHLIMGTTGNPLENIMRDLKRHTSEQLRKVIETTLRWRKYAAMVLCLGYLCLEKIYKLIIFIFIQ